MTPLADMLGTPGCVWSLGTGFAMMAFAPVAPARREGAAWLGESGVDRLCLRGQPGVLAFETLSSDPRGWNHGIALCITGAAGPEAGHGPIGPDLGAILPGDRASPAFALGGDGVVRLLFRPDPAGLARMEGEVPSDPPAGTWVVETAFARIERWQAAGPPPVHRLGGGPAATTPLPPGWRAAAHVFPPHPARARPGQPIGFDPARHAAFQSLLAEHGRADLWRLKRRVNDLLDAGGFAEITTDRHGAAVIRVALRQALAAGRPPPEAWLHRYDPPLWQALRAGEAN